jgi:tetratricopeptide (TPR) repeat protein/predicted O-methyltransferase YrrM
MVSPKMNEKITPIEEQTLTIQQAIDLAVQHHKAGELPKAESIYNQILQSDPNQPVALHLLGVIAHQVGKNDFAVDLITKALAIKPSYAEAYSNLGNALHGLGKLDEAMDSYNKAIDIKPDNAEAHSNLGNTLKDLGKIDEAVASYNKALDIKPDYADAHSNLGNALQLLGKLEEAMDSCNKAIDIKPDFAEAHSNLGVILQELGQLDEAVDSYNKALAIKPSYAEVHYNLGNAFKDLGMRDEAVASYNKALAIKPDYVEAHSNLVVVRETLVELGDTIVNYRKTTKTMPDYAEALNKSGAAIHELKLNLLDPPFSKPAPLEYEDLYRPGMGTENVGPLLRSLIQMVRPKRLLEVGAGYTTPFLLEAIVNNERVFNDGNLAQSYFDNYAYEPKLVVIDDMSLGELAKQPGMKEIIDSKYVDFVEGRFQGKAEQLLEKYGKFDFVWYDCGGTPDYEDFFSEYWEVCSSYVLFHFTYSDGKPNVNMEVILKHIPNDTLRFDIVETHKKSQGSVTIIRKG